MQEEANRPINSQREEKINLIEYADRSCKKCYGRGYTGHYGDNVAVICPCVKRNYRARRRHTITPETLVKDVIKFNHKKD